MPGREKILITPPTDGMYTICVQANDVDNVKVNFEFSGEGGEGGENGRFSSRVDKVKKAIDVDLSVLSRKPYWDTHLPRVYPATALYPL